MKSPSRAIWPLRPVLNVNGRVAGLVALGLGIALGLLSLSQISLTRGFSPQLLVLTSTEPFLSTEITLEPSISLTDCEQKRQQLSSAVSAGCQSCRIERNQCIPFDEDSPVAQWLHGQPVAEVVTQIPGGLIRYPGASDELALQTCQASRAQQPATLRCFEANAPRPSVMLPRDPGLNAQQLSISSFGQFLLLPSLALLAFGAWLLLPRATRWLGAEVLRLPVWGKQLTMIASDLMLILGAGVAALGIRLETIPPSFAEVLMPYLPLSAGIYLVVIYVTGLYRSVIRHLGLQALLGIGKAVALATLANLLLLFALEHPGLPRSVPIIQGLLLMISLGASRALARHWLSSSQRNHAGRRPVLIYGAGSAGVQLTNALINSAELKPVGLIDDNRMLQSRSISGLKVYAPGQLKSVVSRQRVQEVLLAIPSASPSVRRAVVESIQNIGISVRTLPGLAELADGKVKLSELRDVRIEDLLGREPVASDPQLLSATIEDKVVMVTGAGGSIGSELCRQILLLKPSHLILYEQSEFALYELSQGLTRLQSSANASGGAMRVTALLASVTDATKVSQVIKAHGVQTIFHAAAYKHVPIVEDNICAGALNNAIGTWIVAKAAVDGQVQNFVLISTDKAVRPANIMGATKRLAELAVQALADSQSGLASGALTRFSIVRFGNVLGSSGSVIPLFRQQIQAGGPLTVTDNRVIRYFMTIEEAASLVIQAGAMSGRDAEAEHQARVFVLDMGEPVKIMELAGRMIRLSGLSVRDESNPGGDIEIRVVGLRPGEKLYEELLIGEEVLPSQHPRIFAAREHFLPYGELVLVLQDLMNHCLQHREVEVVRLIRETVLEFKTGEVRFAGTDHDAESL